MKYLLLASLLVGCGGHIDDNMFVEEVDTIESAVKMTHIGYKEDLIKKLGPDRPVKKLRIDHTVIDQYPEFVEALMVAVGEFCYRGLGCAEFEFNSLNSNVVIDNDCITTTGTGAVAYARYDEKIALCNPVGYHNVVLDIVNTDEACLEKEDGVYKSTGINLARHELGHYLGYGHVEAEDHFMYDKLGCKSPKAFPAFPDSPEGWIPPEPEEVDEVEEEVVEIEEEVQVKEEEIVETNNPDLKKKHKKQIGDKFF